MFLYKKKNAFARTEWTKQPIRRKISLSFLIFSLSSFVLFSACTDYQEEFENAFGALEYSNESSDSTQDISSDSGTGKSSSSANEKSSSSVKSSSSSKKESSSSSVGSSSAVKIVVDEEGVFTDKRDNQKYKVVKVGDQVWLAQNLAYNMGNGISPCYQYDCSAEDHSYGRFYTWIDAQKACPDGWHLPSKGEIGALTAFVGGDEKAVKSLKAKETWTKGAGTDDFGFALLAAGSWNGKNAGISSNYSDRGQFAFVWSGDEYVEGAQAYVVMVNADKWDVTYHKKDMGFSVRCVVDAKNVDFKSGSGAKSSSSAMSSSSAKSSSSATSSSSAKSSSSAMSSSSAKSSSSVASSSSRTPISYGTMSDGKNSYKTVKIGSQVWMAENLNGPEVEGSSCYDGNPVLCAEYGRLYNLAAAQEACPTDWHLPTEKEFKTLVDAVGGYSRAGKILKAQNFGGDDTLGFGVLAGGQKSLYGYFVGAGDSAYFWMAPEGQENYHATMSLDADDVHIYSASAGGNWPKAQMSIRCVQDTPKCGKKEYDPEVQFCDKRDSTIYKQVTIGDQTWMAENLNVEVTDSYCYNDTAKYCGKYGRLYTWSAANTSCPSGWHLPTSNEIFDMKHAVGWGVAGVVLMSETDWNGKNGVGFDALPAGYMSNTGSYSYINSRAFFWTSTEEKNGVTFLELKYSDNANNWVADITLGGSKEYAYSVRCVKN